MMPPFSSRMYSACDVGIGVRMDPVEKHVIERNLGEQPISGLMAQLGLKPHDLVAASQSPITHKLIARACKGRRLTPYSQALVLDALNRATEGKHRLNELFNY